jgi:hypothetical protein
MAEPPLPDKPDHSQNNGNGQADGHTTAGRRLRLDERAAIRAVAAGPGSGLSLGARSQGLPAEGHSGRRLVLTSAVILLAIWGVLYLVFRDWKLRYQARVDFGLSHVVRAVEPLTRLKPPAVPDSAWQDAIEQTRAMLETVVRSNLLSRDQMDSLRIELDQAVSRAQANPALAVDALASIWNRMADRAEFLLTEKERHPRPGILPPRPSPRSPARPTPTTSPDPEQPLDPRPSPPAPSRAP